MPFGYLGTTPNQQLNNSGVFSVEKALQVQKDGEWGGSLQLIEEQTVSGVSAIDFTSIQEAQYDVHLLQWSGIYLASSTQNYLEVRFSNNGGTSYINSAYQYASQYVGTNGQFGELKETSGNAIRKISYSATSGQSYVQNAYVYLYNLGNSSKYSFTTHHSFSSATSSANWGYFGGGVYPTAEVHNAIKVFSDAGTNFSGTAKLYGVKQI